MESQVTLNKEMHFIGSLDGFDINLDADEQFGGKNKGSKPKGLVLTALAGCTAMDVISIIRKMRQPEPEHFSVKVTAELTDSHPKTFKSFLIKYIFKGNIAEERVKRAVELSLNDYCGVAAMLKKVGPVDYEIRIN